jgi:hypothetical protein
MDQNAADAATARLEFGLRMIADRLSEYNAPGVPDGLAEAQFLSIVALDQIGELKAALEN